MINEHPTNKHWTHEQLKAKKWEGQPWEFAHRKEDGWRVTFFRQPSNIEPVAAYGKDRSRTGERREDLEFLYRFPRLRDDPFVKRMFRNVKSYSSIDCEIVTANGIRSDVTTALRDPSIPIKILPFALPYVAGQPRFSMPITWAREMLVKMGFNDFVHFEVLPTKLTRDDLMKLVTDGSEGWVLKSGGQYGKWFKVKAEPTVDCIVTGTIDGQGKYAGLIGSLVVSVYNPNPSRLEEIASVSGMTDDDRVRMTDLLNDDQLIGDVVEVKYQMVGSGGRLIHPRYVRHRFDKPAKDCTIDQLKEGE